MTVKLLVIGERTPRDAIIEQVARKVSGSTTTHIRRCRSPELLVDIVRSVRHSHGPIDSLDLYDHGTRGAIVMGAAALFGSDSDPTTPLTGAAIAAELAPLLSELAHLRLLGCDTAILEFNDPEGGRMMLLKLARLLGPRRSVFGTIVGIGAGCFDRDGFNDERVVELLCSAYTAIDFTLPTYNQRQLALNDYWLAAPSHPQPPSSERQA